MKKTILLFCIISYHISISQIFTTNRKPVGLEHNILFNAQSRYNVVQQGSALNISALFDGNMSPSYTNGIVTTENPTVILIEELPSYHTQVGAWVGWTTRYWPAKRFKIEGYDEYFSPSGWRIIADYSSVDYSGYDFSTPIPTSGVYTKLKFTFYVSETEQQLGISELFFIHPEATYPYAGLLTSTANNWDNNGSNLVYSSSGNVGIGLSNPTNKLDVNGTIHSKQVKVDMSGWSDFVFKKEYNIPTLDEVEKHINKNGHLENIPTEEEVVKDGINLGEMNAKLLQKIEELTLYAIEQQKKMNTQSVLIEVLQKENETFKKLSQRLSNIEEELKNK